MRKTYFSSIKYKFLMLDGLGSRKHDRGNMLLAILSVSFFFSSHNVKQAGQNLITSSFNQIFLYGKVQNVTNRSCKTSLSIDWRGFLLLG